MFVEQKIFFVELLFYVHYKMVAVLIHVRMFVEQKIFAEIPYYMRFRMDDYNELVFFVELPYFVPYKMVAELFNVKMFVEPEGLRGDALLHALAGGRLLRAPWNCSSACATRSSRACLWPSSAS